MPLRRIARPLLAAAFVAGGIDALLNPTTKANAAKPLLDKAQEMWPAARSVDPVVVVQVGGVTKVGAGTMLALGRCPRLAAALLALELIPSTAAEHPFWSETHPDERKIQQLRFMKNLGLLGGLLFAITDTQGKPSLAWRAKRAKKVAKKRAEKLSKTARTRLRQD